MRIFLAEGHIHVVKGRAVRDCRWHRIWRMDMEKLLNIIMRGILGTIAIYFINAVLERTGLPLGVGINAATVLTSGILGFPGLLALYGIGLYKTL